LLFLVQLFSRKPPDQQPSSTSDCCSSFSSSPNGLPDDNPSSFGDHCGFGRHSGLDGLASCFQDLLPLISNFSAKNLLINSHQAHQIAAHPFHHLLMGLTDDNPSSFGDHCGFGLRAGLDELA
jgi:hypothetical protein